jgi:hypothetical protein
MKLLYLLIKRRIKIVLMGAAWNRDDTWSALSYEEDIKQLDKEIEKLW